MTNISRSLVANMSRIAKSGWAELFRPHNLYSCHGFAGISTFNEPAFARENGQPSSKVFVSHSIRKPKAELVIQPKGPQFTVMDSGGIMLAKEGAMFFSFVPAIGVNKYDMTKKQTMAVSVSELGALLSLGPNDSCEFFHDPYVGKSEAGRVRKIMKVEPFPDQTGYYFMLSVADRMLNVDDLLLVPITKGEFAVMHSAFNHMLGLNYKEKYSIRIYFLLILMEEQMQMRKEQHTTNNEQGEHQSSKLLISSGVHKHWA